MSRKRMSFGAATGVVVAIVTAVWVAFSDEARSEEARYLDQPGATIAIGRHAVKGEGE